MIKRGQMHNREIIRTRPLCMNPSTSTQLCQTAWAIIFSNSCGLESDYRAPSVTQTLVPKQVTSWVFICIPSKKKKIILLPGICGTQLCWVCHCLIKFCSLYRLITWNPQRGKWVTYLLRLCDWQGVVIYQAVDCIFYQKYVSIEQTVVPRVQCGPIWKLIFLCLLLPLILVCCLFKTSLKILLKKCLFSKFPKEILITS